jgi:hypothetical protein
MLKKALRLAILVSLALAPFGASHAADVENYCRLKGGSLVPLTAAACAAEGGTMVSAEIAPAAAAVAAGQAAPASQLPDNPTLDQAQKLVVDILGRTVGTAASGKKPEGIERTARFDGCRLVVAEQLHMDIGNLLTSRKNLKIDSAIDFRNLNRKSFGALGKVSSKAGDLGGEAIFFEEPWGKAGKHISISVQIGVKDSYARYTTDASSAYLEGPRDYYWIADGYGYPRETRLGDPALDKVRILFIVNTPDEAALLMKALDKVSAMCRPQQAETSQQKK